MIYSIISKKTEKVAFTEITAGQTRKEGFPIVHDEVHRKKDARLAGRRKWAKAAGDHAVLSAMGSKSAGKYLQDVDNETSESLRFKPASGEDSRVGSVKPSCCARRDEQPRLAGQIQLATGKAEIGYDEKTRDMVFSFVRHENDSEGREVQENKARVRTLHDKDRFRSNDEDFATGAMEMRCEAARSAKTVMRRFDSMSSREGGDTTMDRVLPFQRVDKEREKIRRLREMEHESVDDRSGIHSAASAVSAFAGKKRQKQAEFRRQFVSAVAETKKNTKTDDYQLYIRKKWEAMVEQGLAEEPGGLPEREPPDAPEETGGIRHE